MQINGLILSSISDASLEPLTPMWQVLLFEKPLVVSMVLLVIGLGLMARGQITGSGRWWAMGGAGLVLSVGVWGLAKMVQTKAEKVTQTMTAAVGHTAPYDAAAFMSLLAPQAKLTGPDGDVLLTRQVWPQAFERAIGGSGGGGGRLAEQTVASWQAGVLPGEVLHGSASALGGVEAETGKVVAGFLDLRTKVRAGGGGVGVGGGGGVVVPGGGGMTRWLLIFEQAEDGVWLIRELRCLSHNGGSPKWLLSYLGDYSGVHGQGALW